MSYLEELLPEFRNGAKIRLIGSRDNEYYYIKHNVIYNQNGTPIKDFSLSIILADVWEFYQEPIDWDYIIKNKCLCWFWDNDDKYKSIEKLACINDKADYPFENIRGGMYRHCHPVLKDEVTFYENKNNE